jgi:hypothetical protein
MDSVTGSQRVQVGDGNVQISLFTGGQPRRPVVAGNIPQPAPGRAASPPATSPARWKPGTRTSRSTTVCRWDAGRMGDAALLLEPVAAALGQVLGAEHPSTATASELMLANAQSTGDPNGRQRCAESSDNSKKHAALVRPAKIVDRCVHPRVHNGPRSSARLACGL